MLEHPFYRAWNEGRLGLGALREYAAQYFHHVEAFPRAVSAVHANCPDASGRRLLAENLAEEEGLGEGKDSHAKLWLDFAEGMGVSEAAARGVELEHETRALIETFRRLSRRSYAAGLGALYVYESQLPAVAEAKIRGLKDFYGVEEERAIRFFKVHEEADVAHSEVCRGLLDTLSEAEQGEAVAAGIELAEALWDFLSARHRPAKPA
jgi:pyrroloquinoline-quinone synthase